MDELSHDARRLIDTAMRDEEPPSPDASWGALVVRLTGESPQAFRDPAAAAAAAARKPSTRSTPWIALAVVIAIAAIAGWIVVRNNRDDAPATAPGVARTVPAREPAAIPTPARIEPAVPTPAVPLERLLPEAEAAIAGHDAARALALLERHAERAPLTDAERRMALRVLALCGLERRDDARAEARAFLAAHPESRWKAEVQASCATP